MKKLLYACAFVLICFASASIKAQAFEKKNILFSLGIGGTSDLIASTNGESIFSPPQHITIYPIRPQFMFKAEFAVRRYWGVGFIASVDGRANMLYTSSPGYSYRTSQLNTQLGLLVNYHFYQLIADKFHRDPKLHADKLDIYTGFTIGANVNFARTEGHGFRPVFSPFMGLHLGARYYVTTRLSVFGEIGIGQSYFNTGITIRLSATPKQKIIKN